MSKLAEEKGFEPLNGCPLPVFKTSQTCPSFRALAVALGWSMVASACVYAGPAPDDAPPVIDHVQAEPCPVVEPPPVHETPLSPRGVYCTPSIVWEFGEGQVSLYHSTTGQMQRGWVVRDDERLAVAWMVACDGGELGDGVAVCEHVDSWPLVTTADAITVGGVTAVGEWAGGCEP